MEITPLSGDLYGRLGEGGRKLQAEFEQRLQTGLSGLSMELGTALLVVPAHNESRDIEGTLDSVLASIRDDEWVGEAVVVDNRSTDDTREKVRAWARRHPSEVRFVEGSRPLAPSRDGRPVLRLMSQDEPGKTAALLTVRRLFEASGRYPEWMVQLDADTHLSKGAAGTLIRDAEADREVATGGRHRPRMREGRTPFEKVHFAPFRDDTIPGGFLAARTPVWVAGLEAIHARYPQAITEDKLFTALIKIAGFKIGGKNPRAPVETLAPTTLSDFRSRNARFLAGDHQAEALFGPVVMKEVGLKRTWETEVRELTEEWIDWAQDPAEVCRSVTAQAAELGGRWRQNPAAPLERVQLAVEAVLRDPEGAALTGYDLTRAAVPYALAVRDAGGIAAEAENRVFTWEPVR